MTIDPAGVQTRALSKGPVAAATGVVGILPTILADGPRLCRVLGALDAQTCPCSMHIVVFQGTADDSALVRAAIAQGNPRVPVRVDHSVVRSLTAAKNRAVEGLPGSTRAVFIYEDDVSYPPSYNQTMLSILDSLGAGMVSCVELRSQGVRQRLAAFAFRLTHLPPLNDRRPELSSSPATRTIRTRFLSGGLTVVDAKVFARYRYDEKLTGYCPGEDMDFSCRVSRAYPTYLTSAVRCLHNSVGIRKMAIGKRVIEKLNAWLYFAGKNARFGWAAVIWLLCALFVETLLASAASCRPAVLTGWLRSLRSWVFHRRYCSEYILP